VAKFWKFWQRKEKAPTPPTGQTLPDIVRGMQHAANTAQQMLQQHWRDTLDQHFDDKGMPVIETFHLPSGHVLDVATIAMVSPKGLNLETLEIEMSVRIDQADTKTHKSASLEDTAHTRTSFRCSLAPVKDRASREMNAINVKMVFKVGDPPEAVARVIEEFTSLINPKKESPPALPAAPSPPESPPSEPEPPAPSSAAPA